MKVLHLIDSLDYSGSARQVRLLGRSLAAEGLQVAVCCLGQLNEWGESLRRCGVHVHALGWRHWLDLGALRDLAGLVRQTAPEVIHVWRAPALRALAVAARERLPSVVMSAPLPAQGRLAWWDRWLLRRVRCVALAGASDRDRFAREGLAVPAHVVAPAAWDLDAPPPAVEKSGRHIVCVGRLERPEGFRFAIWAFDILRGLYPECRLQLVGDGSQRHSLQALSEGLQVRTQVDFLGSQEDVSSVFGGAGIVWCPSIANCGRQVVLEAMAHGCVVIAADVPALREVVSDGQTGYLVPVGQSVPLARRTHALFQEELLRDRLARAARARAAREFSLAGAARRWVEIYTQGRR
jgi:glycosyltransferase involved in cell wall biosynthesis